MQIKNKNGDVIYAVDADTLSEANLCWANLREADLRGADLREADLSEADLRWADLREADLRWADLREADLRWADLREAKLRGADLREADLRWADLSEADLRWADLSAKQFLCQIHGSRHPIVAIDDDVRIGCMRQSLAKWLECFEAVGTGEGYSPSEIAEYGIYLRAIAAALAARSPGARP